MNAWARETIMSFKLWLWKIRKKIGYVIRWRKVIIAMKIRQLRCDHQWRFLIECIATGQYKIKCTKCGKLKKDLTRNDCQL